MRKETRCQEKVSINTLNRWGLTGTSKVGLSCPLRLGIQFALQMGFYTLLSLETSFFRGTWNFCESIHCHCQVTMPAFKRTSPHPHLSARIAYGTTHIWDLSCVFYLRFRKVLKPSLNWIFFLCFLQSVFFWLFFGF